MNEMDAIRFYLGESGVKAKLLLWKYHRTQKGRNFLGLLIANYNAKHRSISNA